MRNANLFVTVAALLAALPAFAQDTPAQKPIAYVPIDNLAGGVKVSGALDVSNGRASIGSSGTVTAGDRAASIALVRGGQLLLCSTTTVHLTTDRSVNPTDSTALLIALDRGAMEASFTTGKYSDVLLTPDFRILVSGPGAADLKVRVSSSGDTCIDNHGAGAPYVTVSSQFDEGAYRVQPNQRVLFEHGSLHDVVDNESEPCGCPPPQTLSTAQLDTPVTAPPTQAAADPAPAPGASAGTSKPLMPTNAGTEFPLAVSEGLAPAPPPPTTPVAAPGEVHVQVTVPLAYDGKTGQTTTAAAPAPGAAAVPAAPPPPAPTAVATPPPAVQRTVSPAPAPAASAKADSQPRRGVFHRIGHFFSRLFGG